MSPPPPSRARARSERAAPPQPENVAGFREAAARGLSTSSSRRPRELVRGKMLMVGRRRGQRGSAAMLLVLWAFVAIFYFLFAPQIAASMKAFDAVAATEDAYLDNIARRLEDYYRRNAAAIDSATAYPVVPESLCAELGVELKPTLRLAASDRLTGSQVLFHRFVVWLKRAEPDPSTFAVSTGTFTPGPNVIYRIVDGEAIEGALLEKTLEGMKGLAAQLERRFRAKFEADPLRSLSVNYFRALGSSCSVGLDDIPCVNSYTDATAAADFVTLLSIDPATLTSARGHQFPVSHLDDSSTASPPYTMAIRAALPSGGSLLVNAVQPLN